MATGRFLSSILFTDIVGSTQHAVALGDHRWRELLGRHHEHVRREIRRYGGDEIDTAGDGFLVLFDAPARALACADAICRTVGELNLRVRCGIHFGQIERTAGDVGGIAVHTAARIAALAGPGEVLASSTVRDTEAGSGFGFEDRGLQELRGIPGQWRIYALKEVPRGLETHPGGPEPRPDLWTRVRRSRFVRVLLIYAAGSWLVLQTTQLFITSLGMPGWAMSAAAILLLIGLVVVLATAWVQKAGQPNSTRVIGVHATKPGTRRTATPQESRTLRHRLFTWRNVARGGVAALAVWGIGVSGWLLLGRGNASEWDAVAGMAEIERLVGQSQYAEAYAIAQDLDERISSDSVRNAMWARVSVSGTLLTRPAGARVFRRDYAPAGSEWTELGRTPLNVERMPLGMTRLRFELPGHRTRELAFAAIKLTELDTIALDPDSALPPEMARVPGATADTRYGLFAPGLEQVAPVDLTAFNMAVHEVTNRAYKAFVDAGGYTDRSCWQHPFVLEGKTLSFEEAMARFRDGTGRPGPAMWDAGTYRRGTAEHPVGGVSWFEAAAYACWAGMSLPTVYHWYRAAGPLNSPHVVPLSNFGDGPAPVGQYEGVNRDGVYDLAGNVREWTENANGEARFILGGGWDDQEYAFNDAVTAPAFDRSPMNGIRLVQYPDTTNLAAARAPLVLAFRDYRAEKPVSEEVFAAYRQIYALDDAPLNARVVATDSTELWIRQRVEMDAGYGGERLTTFLFLPRDRPPPYQTVVFFPGSNVIYRRSYADLSLEPIDFLVRSGRAVIYPIYKGTFERSTDLESDIQDRSNGWRDHVIAWSKDMRRSVDYAATRADLAVADQLAYLGISWGSAVAPIMVALEPRIRAVVLIVGGLLMQDTQPVVDPFHFLPRVRQPTIMLSARYDSFYPLETAVRPFFDNLGTPPDQRKLVIYDANHGVFGYARNGVVKETLDWLDLHVAPVK